MPNNYFKFKKFIVYHDKCAMKVGTDGVLLGAWASLYCDNAKNILDIGTGCGVIALMMAQKSDAIIDSVEIDRNAALQAEENFKISPWAERMKVECVSFQNYTTDKKYDVIVSNPPYFIESLKSDNISRMVARHTQMLPYNDIIDGVLRVMQDDGGFFAIFPYEEANIFTVQAALKGLYAVRRVDIRGTIGNPIKRVMIHFSKHKSVIENREITIEDGVRHKYSDAYMELTSDFYIKF